VVWHDLVQRLAPPPAFLVLTRLARRNWEAGLTFYALCQLGAFISQSGIDWTYANCRAFHSERCFSARHLADYAQDSSRLP
jgi:hypothetical protein